MREYFIWLTKFITKLVIFFLIVPFSLFAIFFAAASSMDSSVPNDKRSVAVLELTGTIKDSKDVLEQLYKQAANDKVKGIVLRVDSPGGAIAPSQEIYSAVKTLKAKKPIVVSMGSVAASGGLYVSLGASRILAEPGTMTGSIGVIMQIPNFTKVANLVGVDFVTIKSGKLKDVGNSFRPMTDEEKQFLQSTILVAYEDFVKAVSEGRGIEISKVREFADGRVILGTQAKELNLIDGYGDLVDAARAVFEIRGEPLKADEQPKLFYPQGKFDELAKYLQSFSDISDFFSARMELQYLMH